jgi:hypothetical protein
MSEIDSARLKADAKALEIWEADPVCFVKDVFNAKPEFWQEEALAAIVEHDRIAMRSGHGVGKTTFLSWVILWWLTVKSPAKVACTAPTSHQLKDVLWSEIAKWHQKMPDRMRAWSKLTTDRIEYMDTHSFAVARTARKESPEAFQGFHSENMLFIIDEASGVEEIIFEVGAGAMTTKGAKTIMPGNPTRTSGYFFDAFHKQRKYWHNIHVSCFESSLVSPDYIEEMALKYGKDSNVYKVRVLGDFPTEEDDTIIPLHLLEGAVNRDVMQTGEMIWGVDVARFGDDRSTLAKRWGNTLLEPVKSWMQKDTMQLAGIIKHDYDNTQVHQRPYKIMVDVIGLGAGVVDRLREMNLPVVGINVAERAAANAKYMRLKDELWFKCKEWLEARDCKLAEDEELIGELSLPKYSFNSNGKIEVESKKQLKDRGLRSPDVADSFVLTFAAIDDRPNMFSNRSVKRSELKTFERFKKKGDSNGYSSRSRKA